jgi:hypothetical protein
MKLSHLTLLILLFPTSFFAQDYIPLVVEDKHWITVACGTQGGGGMGFGEHLLRGDTVIDGMTYKKIIQRQFQIPEDNQGCDFIENGVSKPYVIINENYVGAIRENIEEKKVWLLPNSDDNWYSCYPTDEEILIFDFAQNIGDTLAFCPTNFEEITGSDILDITLQSSGEITYFFGERRKSSYGYEYNIYEGIGNRLGIQMPQQLFFIVDEGYYHLLDVCTGTDFECLFDNTSVHNILPTTSVKIIPSPSNGNFSLQLEREIGKNTFLQIINSQGNILLKQAVTNQSHRVSTDLPTGLYFLSLIEDGKQIWSGKTIIKD